MDTAGEEGAGSLCRLWAASYAAERAGELTRALAIHEQILSVIGVSYAGYLRAGWLHYQAGGYRRALHFYITALLLSPDEAFPMCGIMNCHLALGDSERAERAAQALHVAEARMHSPEQRMAV
jgi:tetratricopeptide (TPR) repeat protein